MLIGYVEDDAAQAQLIRSWMENVGHECRIYECGQPFLRDLARASFDFLIIDWELPDADGYEILLKVRQTIDWRIPVLFVTNRDSEQDIVRALENGADDYIIKPAKRMETLARIKALSRRLQPQDTAGSVFESGAFRFDRDSRQIRRDGELIEMTQKEFDFALLLFQHAGRVFSRRYLLEKIWGQTADIQTRTTDTHASRIRSKLGLYPENGWQLISVYQHGYRLERVQPDDAPTKSEVPAARTDTEKHSSAGS